MKSRLISPKYINILFFLQIVLHFVIPIKTIIPVPYSYFGILLITAGIILNIYSVLYLKEQKTTINFDDEPKILVMTGPFSVARNPIYLSGVILALGIAVLLGSLISLLIAIVLFIILNQIYIPAEEKILVNKFGKEYNHYKQRVRRWI